MATTGRVVVCTCVLSVVRADFKTEGGCNAGLSEVRARLGVYDHVAHASHSSPRGSVVACALIVPSGLHRQSDDLHDSLNPERTVG